MDKQEVKQFFDNFSRSSTMQRIDAKHPLDIFLGLSDEGLKTLFVISKIEFGDVKSSKGILVNEYKKDNENILTFKLKDKTIEDLFYIFCSDIIESTRYSQKTNGNAAIINRYLKWRELFAKQKLKILSESEIKGLIGEILFLKKYMIPTFGEEKAINSWLGTMGADQDFVIDSTWFEIKSINSGAKGIEISSIEQLDTNEDGKLIVIELNKTASTSSNAINLNELIENTLNGLNNINAKEKFEEIIFNFGYIKDEEYNNYTFEMKRMKTYLVDCNFPRIRRNIIPNEIIALKYEISTSEIEKFYKGDIL